MSYLDWKVGDRVVCVDDRPAGRANMHAKVLHKGAIYTVRAVTIEFGKYAGVVGEFVILELDEAVNPFKVGDESDGFAAARFRKVQPRKTSIACFEAILNGHRVPEDA